MSFVFKFLTVFSKLMAKQGDILKWPKFINVATTIFWRQNKSIDKPEVQVNVDKKISGETRKEEESLLHTDRTEHGRSGEKQGLFLQGKKGKAIFN